MWKFSNHIFVCFVFLIFSSFTSAQNCNLTISGFVKDKSAGPISYANVYLKEIQKGDVTDSLGFFKLESICAGEYHLFVSHVGCEIQELYLNISGDTVLNVLLEHNSQLLNEAVVVGKEGKVTTQHTQSLNSESIAQNSHKNLAQLLDNISGVSTIKNGGGISKPVVHGLYGNRLTILNNGVSQSGQQWGVDHSPEIDPLVANNITVIQGVGALEYQGNSLGSVVLVEPKKIDQEPHLHGKGRYFFETNGLANGLNLEMQQYGKSIAWRVVGTLKKSGDNRTSKYYLRNTGRQEANIAIQFQKAWNKKWSSELYFSSFNAAYGILRGSHIGNITDLEDALKRDVPFFTEDKFSYAIQSPYQKVHHYLLKFQTKYNITDKEWLDLTYAGQYNLRKEFDVRRSGRSDIPSLSMRQGSNTLEAKYQNYLSRNLKLSSGIQVNRVENTNLPETGILPLIPDYIVFEFGAFGLISKSFESTSFELGARYDFESRHVVAISMTIPREIVRYDIEYSNQSAIGGITQKIGNNWEASYNIGYAARNPEANELFSNGLHQGVSGIEEGDPSLDKEISIKNTLSLKGNVKGKLFIKGLLYYQKIGDYIFLNPQDEVRLTIRGAFPVFKYEQTNAQIKGFDIAATYELSNKINIVGKFSYLNGYDLTRKLPLVYMPSNNLYGALNYDIPKFGKFQNVEFQINSRFVFKQQNLLSSQDFVDPPESYHLVGLKLSAEKQFNKLRLNIFTRAENLLNESYRDYLNRQRYFADDMGFNLITGIIISF